ncbi:hypothetical protein ACIBSV_15340 [Embleya sp. NPDC050154]|uniref:RapZ C-terminal domain-containing protein n=1 Tax=Embleya sp. NPDC050154 TaxID=3363988 RepID=UPI0037B9A055
MTNHSTARVIRVVSFGYGHADAPEAEITLDLRRRFRNPHGDPTMRYRTGLDEDVFEDVLDTPGVRDLAAVTALAAHDLAHAVPDSITIACGCVGGRHRSVAVARHVADILADGCSRIEVEHRDVDRPLLDSTTHGITPPLSDVGRTCGFAAVSAEIDAERAAQDAKFGEQNWPDGTGGPVMRFEADRHRDACQHLAAHGGPDWRSILLEEVYEALAEDETARLRAELVQVAAVAAAWIEAIDRRPTDGAESL